MNFYVTVYIDLGRFFVGSGSSQINRFWPALALAPVHCCRYTIFKLFLKTVLIISGSAWIRIHWPLKMRIRIQVEKFEGKKTYQKLK